jgi:phosphatidate cytidylyltransferase
MSLRPPLPTPEEIPDVGGETPVPSRAGRNLPAAITVGVSLAGLILLTIYTQRILFGVGVITAAICIAIWEMTRAVRTTGVRVPIVPLVAGAPVMIAGAYLNGAAALLAGLVGTVLVCLAWLLVAGDRLVLPGGVASHGVLRDFAATSFIALYVPFLAGFAAMLTAPGDGARRIVAFVLTTAGNDIGGYAAGVLFGKHAMAPTVSPKKSWEGFAGSVAVCVMLGMLVVGPLLQLAMWQGALYGVAVAAAATVGDLGESMIKRDIGIKDMGHLLPGHGGLMDRLDSLLVVAPVAWLLLSAWAPHS